MIARRLACSTHDEAAVLYTSHATTSFCFQLLHSHFDAPFFAKPQGLDPKMSAQSLETARCHSTGPDEAPSVEPKKSEDSLLLHWDEVPEWQQDNRYILTGYRKITHSYRKAISSLAYLHNQTGNIFSHLLAIPTLVISAVVAYYVQNISLAAVDCLILALFVVGASTCFLLSTCFHTFASHSPTVEQLWVRIDFTGIVIITATTFVAGEYYLFYCEQVRMTIHVIIVSTTRRRQAGKHADLIRTDNLLGSPYDHRSPHTHISGPRLPHLQTDLLLSHGYIRICSHDR